MADIQPYVRTLYLRSLPKNLGLPNAYARRDEIVDHLTSQVLVSLADFDVNDRIDVVPIVDQLFSEFLSSSCFAELSDEFAGKYYKPAASQIDIFKQTALNNDKIYARSEAVGFSRYFTDVFNAYVNGETAEPVAGDLALPVPASDRIVTLSHNSVASVDPSLTALIEDVRTDNEVLDDGVKERLLGQMRAGQELLRSGSVRAYLLYHTLIRGLMELIARYRGRAIAVAAERLIELLIEHVFEAAA